MIQSLPRVHLLLSAALYNWMNMDWKSRTAMCGSYFRVELAFTAPVAGVVTVNMQS